MNTVSRKLCFLTVVSFLTGATFVSGVAAAAVSCGQVITKDTVLRKDVGPCRSGGLIIGADNITLDLNGHKVFGSKGTGDGIGIELSQRTGVLVKDGTVTKFDVGIAIDEGSNNEVAKIKATKNVGRDPLGDGVTLFQTSNNLIHNNKVTKNGPFSGIGLVGASTTENTIADNVIRKNAVINRQSGHPSPTQETDGIRLEQGANDNVVAGNKITRSGLDGIGVFADSAENLIMDNVVRRNGFHKRGHRQGDGIRVFLRADRTVVRSNSVFGNSANGIRIDSKSNRILSNRTGNNDRARGKQRTEPAFDLQDTNVNPPCDANIWRGNTFGKREASPRCTRGARKN